MKRRCVICGVEPPNDACGKRSFHYPKNRKEARIWQRSLNASNIPLDAIQKYCCVCIEHIPQFVTETQKQAACCCGKMGDPPELPEGMNRSTVNVLLMTGATLPSYCGQSCAMDEKSPNTKTSVSDTDICVLESSFTDGGAKFPDIDSTEFTVMRAPAKDDEQLAQHHQQTEQHLSDEQGTDQTPSLIECMQDCTDVLLLARGHHPTDECPCKCEQCVKQPTEEPTPAPCCVPVFCPEPPPPPPPPPHYDHPPCGCECEQQVRRELGAIISTQQARIQQLESMLSRQNNLHQTLQSKVDELYSEFSRIDPEGANPEQKESRKALPTVTVAPAPEDEKPKAKRKNLKKSNISIKTAESEQVVPVPKSGDDVSVKASSKGKRGRSPTLFRKVKNYLKTSETDYAKFVNWMHPKADSKLDMADEHELVYEVY